MEPQLPLVHGADLAAQSQEQLCDVIAADTNNMSLVQAPPSSYFPWELCPAEIREIIFDAMNCRYCRYFRWRGSMPPLVIAFHGLRKSYQQALQRFVKESRPWLLLHGRITSFGVEEMNQIELDTLREVHIEFE